MCAVQFFQLVCVKFFKSEKLRGKIINAPNACHDPAMLLYTATDQVRQIKENFF